MGAALYTTARNLLVQNMDKVHQNTTWIWWCHEGKPWTKGKKFIGSGWYEFMEIYEKYVWICGGKILEQRTIRHPSPKKKKLGLAHALQSTLLWSSCNELFCLVNIFKIFLQKPLSVSNIIFCRKILAATNYLILFHLVSLVLQSIQICRLFFDLGIVNHIRELFLRSIQETPLWYNVPTHPCTVVLTDMTSNVLAEKIFRLDSLRSLSAPFPVKPWNFSTLNCLALLDGTFTGISEDTYMVSPGFSGLLFLLSPP